MQAEQILSVGSYRVDVGNACVWRGKQAHRLTHKAFAVLQYLVEHAGQVVTKAELFRAVWPEAVVSDAALVVCIREIRKALKDDPQNPLFIKTIHRRGYQFIGPIQRPGALEQRANGRATSGPLSAFSRTAQTPLLVGRAGELGQLHERLAHAQQGERQVVFVTGEPGIGKTTLVDTFVAQLTASTLWVTRGQCLAHYGIGEAYLPLLAALGQLCREPDGKPVLQLLSQQAPTWLTHMSALLSQAELEALQPRTVGATPARMLRELAEALEALTAVRPLVLVLEDLQWSDYATLDWLAYAARRRQPARLLVISTYRPVEVVLRASTARGQAGVAAARAVHGAGAARFD